MYINQFMSQKVIHRFLRQPNIDSSIYNRVGNRYKPFENTLTVLEDPKANRQLYLIGTTNSSTTLAHRTRKLIQQIKPTSVYVQASKVWWNYAQHVNVYPIQFNIGENQNQFRLIADVFPDEQYAFENNPRGIMFRMRYYSWMGFMNWASCLSEDFTPFTPGLETKFALEEAFKANSEVHFGGAQFDPITVEALKTETDMYFHTALWKARKLLRTQNAWNSDYHDFKAIMHTQGAEAFAESFDRSRANLFVQLLKKVAPQQKSILVDLRDERIFRDLYKSCSGDKIVAVVNQWHAQGIETHWRRTTGTQIPQKNESPVADMDIDEYQQRHLINEYLRDYTSKVTKSETATHQEMLTNYHKQNWQNERTRHTHHDSHQDIPNPGQEPKKHH